MRAGSDGTRVHFQPSHSPSRSSRMGHLISERAKFLYASRPLHLLLFPLIGFSSFSSSVANDFSLFRCHLLRQACSDTPTLATRVYLNDPSHLSVNFLIAFVTVCRCLVYWSVFPQ